MFWRLRVLVFYGILSILAIIFFIFGCIPIHLLNARYSIRYGQAIIFSYIFIYLARFICGIRFEVIGLEKLPKDGKPYLVLANHQSFWENFFVQLIFPKHSWVIKKEIFEIPVFGLGLRTVHPIAVDRSAQLSVLQILTEGQKKIKEGLCLIMFPEATRISVDRNVRFKPSAAKLAITANVPIVLMAHNSGLYWPKGFWFQKPGLITVKILEVIEAKNYQDYDVRTLTDYIQERITGEKEILAQKGQAQ